MLTLMTLEQWAKAKFGDNAPKNVTTLRRWARAGKIIPPPNKVGKNYMVKPDAKYHDEFSNELI